MRYSFGALAYGLLFSAPGWAIAASNIGEPAMFAGLAAGMLAYAPFVVTACFPAALREVVAED